ncbi:30S ribosomal protein S3 [Rickettsiales endosymbiont of Stachyamoeba lipophora]|uniref:30S ribosomal protein S3 n=1 Tax=Rickettsiales endosymbiont of Stachyamoeba lipophora TaxID=2486578 RepID=UPI000F648780|nr:30S ribosomal protein S3 [Rickettsiales endosymbiont of Stachyamoeba lipophora]AZL15870.1 30S ribosomal protein S3 [Rickettsiales endosymbiont of Stachyamoeba lipophora]
MGQKCNPIGARLGIKKANGQVRNWDFVFYCADRNEYAKRLHEALKIRSFLFTRLKSAGVSKVGIEGTAGKLKVDIHTSRPGVVIGKKGSDIDVIKKELAKFTKDDIHLNIVEVRKPEVDANIVAQSIAYQIEKRVSVKRAMKSAIQQAMKYNALGIKVIVSGRLGGAEIARTERYHEGRVPLHTFRADVDYALAEAHTTYGVIGVKVWIYRSDNY